MGTEILGYDGPKPPMVVLNGTATALKKGEAVVWDTTTPSSTDKARRVKRATADSDRAFAGVLLNDLPANGGYGPLAVGGTVHARVASDVVAGGTLLLDFVSSNPGRLKARSAGTLGSEYAVVGVAITAAAEEPAAGSGSYWADVTLLGANFAAIQDTLRGGGVLAKTVTVQGIGIAAASTTMAMFFQMPKTAGSITKFVLCSPTAVTGDNANSWIFSLSHVAGTALVVAYTTITGNDISATAPNNFTPATNLTFTSEELMRIDLTVGAGAPPTLAATRLTFYVEYDVGLNYASAFGL